MPIFFLTAKRYIMKMLRDRDNPILSSLQLAKKQKSCLPQTLNFFVTSRCNARCSFCLYFDSVNDPVAKNQELTVDEMDQIASNYGQLHYLALTGGEPFIRQDIAEICQCFIERCDTRVIDIPSNFYYTSNMVNAVKQLVSNNPTVRVDLQLSIDDIGEAHDRSRKVKNLYSIALNTFRILQNVREEHPNLSMKVNIVYLDSNNSHLMEIVSTLAKDINFDRLQITYPNTVTSGDLVDTNEEKRNIDEFVLVESEVLKNINVRQKKDLFTVGMRSVKGIYHKLLGQSFEAGKNVGSYCEAGRNIVVINEVGEVFPCEPLWASIGNLRENGYDMKNILSGDRYKKFREQFLGDGKCNCTWGCAIHSHISVTPKYRLELAWNAATELFSR